MSNYRRKLKVKRKLTLLLRIFKRLLWVILLIMLFNSFANHEYISIKDKKYTLTGEELFFFPCEGLVTAMEKSGSHQGYKAVDIANEVGTPIFAAMDGKVLYAGVKDDYGYCVILEHMDNYSTLYAHLKSIDVQVGQVVNRGDKIAAMGSTGNSTGPHLHFEIRLNGKRQNLLTYYPFLEVKLSVYQD